jgi:hypothetical protein
MQKGVAMQKIITICRWEWQYAEKNNNIYNGEWRYSGLAAQKGNIILSY